MAREWNGDLPPNDGKWVVLARAKLLLDIRKTLGHETYEEQKLKLRNYLCKYFSSRNACDGKLGKSISPLMATDSGGKVLKVRWGLPTMGKSGGLRLVVVAYCIERRVVIAGATFRKDGLTDKQIADAIEPLP